MQIRTAKDIGAAIKQARLQHGMTQVDLAHKLQVAQARISEIERGSPGVAIGTILRMLAALDASLVIKQHSSHRRKDRAPSKTSGEFVDLDAIANTGLAWQKKR